MPERWVVLPADATSGDQLNYSQILAVHAALLPNGQVLFFGGSQHIYDATLRSIDDPRLDNTRIWDPATGTVTRIASPQPLYDLFCCGHTLLANGQLLVVGGTSGYPPVNSDDHHAHYRGSRRTSRFDAHAPAGNPWLPTPDLTTYPQHDRPDASLNPDLTSGSGGRWYPTHALGLYYVYRTDGDTWPIGPMLFVESGADGYG